MVPSTFEENLEKSSFQEAWQYAVETARRKASEVADRLKVLTHTYTHIHHCLSFMTCVHFHIDDVALG